MRATLVRLAAGLALFTGCGARSDLLLGEAGGSSSGSVARSSSSASSSSSAERSSAATTANHAASSGASASTGVTSTGGTSGSTGSTGTTQTSGSSAASSASATSSAGHTALLYGGSGEGGTLYDTWTWDGTAWAAENGPAPQTYPGPCIAALGTTVLLADVWGGSTWTWSAGVWTDANAVPPEDGSTLCAMGALQGVAVLAEPAGEYTYTWNGQSWDLLLGGGAALGAIDSPNLATLGNTLVLYGGSGGGSPVIGDQVWSWDGAAWTEDFLQAQDWGVTVPYPWTGISMASWRGVVVAYDAAGPDPSAPVSTMWTWDGTSWTIVTSGGPPPRTSAAMATVGDTIVLFGGQSITDGDLGDTWVWDGSTWTQAMVPGPSPRSGAAMATVAP